MLIRANSDIPPNTELTQQYLAPEAHFLTRRKDFPLHWDFECDCVLCTTEAKSPDEKHLQRRELVEKIKTLALKSRDRDRNGDARGGGGAGGGGGNGKSVGVGVTNSTIKAIERLTRKLEELHEIEVYGEIPRLLLVHPTIWLTEAHKEKGNHAKVVRWAGEILRNFGFVGGLKGIGGAGGGESLGEGDRGEAIELGRGIVNVESFAALKAAGEAYKALGEEGMGERCEVEAKGMWEVITGCGVGVQEVFKGSR